MSHLQSQLHHQELTEAEQIAAHTTAKQYFLEKQQHLLDEWTQKSNQLFRFTAQVFIKEYQLKANQLTDGYTQDYQELYAKCKKEFEAYCILNRKVQKKNDEIQNFAVFFSAKNTKRSFFSSWKQYFSYQKYLRSLEDKCDKEMRRKTLKNCLKSWNELTIKSNRLKIKNEVLQKTGIEISRIQQEYQKIIKTLEENLEKKLTDLKKEEEEHKLLHDKYEAMYARNKMGSGILQ